MPLTDLQLEELELKYFEEIYNHLINHKNQLLDDLNSSLKIWNDWYPEFMRTARPNYRPSILDKGAERVFSSILPPSLKWLVNSAPIGADLLYETEGSFIHIDVKTISFSGNFGDAKGECEVQKNQTSYDATITFGGSSANFSGPSLPQYYSFKEKPCLTYLIQIIQDNQNNIHNILSILLICIPNGQLKNLVYRDNIVKAGKTGFDKYGHHRDFRYKYSRDSLFREIKNRRNIDKSRVRFIHFDNTLYRGITKDTIVVNPLLGQYNLY